MTVRERSRTFATLGTDTQLPASASERFDGNLVASLPGTNAAYCWAALAGAEELTVEMNANRAVSWGVQLALALWGVLLAVACSGDSSEGSVASSKFALQAWTIRLATPSSLSPLEPSLLASDELRVGSRVQVNSGSSVALGANGAGAFIDTDSKMKDTWSRGTLELRDRSRIDGIAHAVSVLPGNGVVIQARDSHPVFEPLRVLSWQVSFPAATPKDVRLNSGQAQRIEPGSYGTLAVSSGATLQLAAGTYYVQTLQVDSAGTLKLDQAQGPVILYVVGLPALRGTTLSTTGGAVDWLVVYLGNQDLFLERPFEGTVLAPFATLNVRSAQTPYVGYFAAKRLVIDPQTTISYRTPFPILTASTPPGPTCRSLVPKRSELSGEAQQRAYESDVLRYCAGSCSSRADTDRDGALDCADGCPYDPAKTAPGACGCNGVDTDSDHDGIADCVDECPNDPNNNSLGQCGCVGESTLAADGTSCSDAPCRATATTCNGAGVCGNRAACAPSSDCRLVTHNETSYWLCGGIAGGGGAPATPDQARQLCASKGMTLLRVNTLSENRFIAQRIGAPIWLGANSISSAGNWRWANESSLDGDVFWSGGASGHAQNHLFSNWAPDAPAARRCAGMLPSDGRWFDADCTQALGYICEFHPTAPRGSGTRPPGAPDAHPHSGPTCISEAAAGLTAKPEDLIADRANAKNNKFAGAAANPPPPSSVCVDKPSEQSLGQGSGAGCQFGNVIATSTCVTSPDCATYGADFVCRRVLDDSSCRVYKPGQPPDKKRCAEHARCGKLQCPAASGSCDEVTVCNPNTEYTPSVDTGSALDPVPFAPEGLFPNGAPNDTPSLEYHDEPAGAGIEHTWCSLKPQDPESVKPARTPADTRQGSSGSGSPVKVDFDPNILFDANANIKALGESDPLLHAQAALKATVHVDSFLGQPGFDAEIINAVAGLAVKRCSVSDKETTITVLNHDFVSDIGVPIFDTADPTSKFYGISSRCEDSAAELQRIASRAKKAMRDAQQLLSQFHAGKLFSSDLCKQIGVLAADVPGFPGGNLCPPREPTEFTINRFIDYYQAPGGEISRVRDAAASLAQASGELRSLFNDLKNGKKLLDLKFADKSKQESETVLNVPFAIGPVPMLLQIDLFTEYGITGKFEVDLSFPITLEAPTPEHPVDLPVAAAKASVLPHASAGLAAFVGAGVDLGPFGASVGLEGAVTIADVKAPLFASVGLDMLVSRDLRPIPADLGPPVSVALDETLGSGFHFGVPKNFKFALKYSYGAALDLDHVLDGEMNGKLKISFFLFSRTWRKRIAKFNGWTFHFDLISGGNSPSVAGDTETIPPPPQGADHADINRTTTLVADGQSRLGLSEAQVPFVELQYLPPSNTPPPPPGAGTASFDAGRVGKMFYDQQCCVAAQQDCSISGTPACCPGNSCEHVVDAPRDVGVCVPKCKNAEQDCRADGECCSGLICGPLGTCAACGEEHQGCLEDADCCAGNRCLPNHTCGQCHAAGGKCSTDAECCLGFGCNTGVCVVQ